MAVDTAAHGLTITALAFLGQPYVKGAAAEGFDCSGLIQKVFALCRIQLPRRAREQFDVGEKVSKSDLAPGDLVFFSSKGGIPDHVGLYMGANRFLHAARSARRVILSNLDAAWYDSTFVGARRVIPQ